MGMPNWPDTATAGAAIYAAVVATAALALEIRRWFESGPRLSMRLMPQAKTYGATADPDADYIAITVANLGDRATTISLVCVLEYRSIFHRWRGRHCKAGVILNPAFGSGGGTPYVLEPGKEWTGAIRYDDELDQWAKNGKLFVGIHFSHARNPIVRRVVRRRED